MKFKKIIATALTALFVAINTTPCFAIKNKEVKAPQDYRLEAVNINWWDGFNDENLKGYILRTIENNHDLKIATLKTQEYQQFVKISQAGQLPTLSMMGNFARVKMPDTGKGSDTSSMFTLPFIASWEADIFLKNADKTKSAKKAHQASKYAEKSAYLSLASNTAVVYLNIVKLDKLIEEQEVIVQNREKIYELIKLRTANGLSSVFDTTMSDKFHTMSKIALTDLYKERNILLNQLATLIGESSANIDEFQRTPLDEIEYKGEIPKEISSEIVIQRPDIMKAETDLARAGIDVKIARKEFLPTIPITGVLGFNSSSFGSLFDWKNTLALGAIGLTHNFFAGGARVANLKTKKIQYEEAFENYKKTDLEAIQEINDALCKIKYNTQKYNDNVKKYDLEAKNFELSQEKYKEGLISHLDLLQYEENLRTLNFDVTSNKIQQLVDYIGLFKATGGKFDASL